MSRSRQELVLGILLAMAGVYGLIKVVAAEHPALEAVKLVAWLGGGLLLGWLLRGRSKP